MRLLPPGFMRPPTYAFDTIEPSGFEATIDGDTARLVWTTTRDGITVEATVRFGDDGAIELWPRVDVQGDQEPPLDITYPIVHSPKPLSEYGTNDALVCPATVGWLIRRPLQQPIPISYQYAEGNLGCTVQLTAYLEQDAGGFYLATHDPHTSWKQFTFGGGEWSVRTENWNIASGESIECDFPVVIAPLVRGDWFEAAERYREWAKTSPWWPDAPKRETERARWLRDEIWVQIWCTPATPDWSIFYKHYADVFAPSPLHIVPGYEWPATFPNTVGFEGWFPAQIHENNLASWDGHYVTPYLNDWFVSPSAENFIEEWEPEVVRPYEIFSMLGFSHTMGRRVHGKEPVGDPRVMTDTPFYFCPHGTKQRELRAWHDLVLMRDYNTAGSFYDISSGCPWGMSKCTREDHDHPPGRGRHMLEQLDVSNRHAKDHVEKELGRYLVQGTEQIIESIIPSVDFYIARTGGGPLGFLEAWTCGPEGPPGENRELIPLFQAIYHDVGPVHEDGWFKMTREEGDLFYWLVARIYLRFGGLFQSHYPLDPPERPPGYDGGSEVIAWGGETLIFDPPLPELDMDKVAFLKELGRARTTFANAYLSYGRMLRDAPFECGTIDLGFHQELPLIDSFRNVGTWTVPQVTHAAWADDATGNVGIDLHEPLRGRTHDDRAGRRRAFVVGARSRRRDGHTHRHVRLGRTRHGRGRQPNRHEGRPAASDRRVGPGRDGLTWTRAGSPTNASWPTRRTGVAGVVRRCAALRRPARPSRRLRGSTRRRSRSAARRSCTSSP